MPLPGHSVAIQSSAVRAGAFAAADRARTRAALTSAVPMTPGGLRQAAHVLQCLSARNSLTDELSGGRCVPFGRGSSLCAEYILLYLRFAIVNAGVAMAGITIKVRHAHARARHSREFWGRGRGILGLYLGLGGARQVDGTGLANRGWLQVGQAWRKVWLETVGARATGQGRLVLGSDGSGG